MKSRMLQDGETALLQSCLEELADYHNRVSLYHKGAYPTKSFAEILEDFAREMKAGTAEILILEEGEETAGFCKIHEEESLGELDYLIVREPYRGKGYGKLLMDWAMERFRKKGIERIGVKVIAGNETKSLYEAYGFKLNSHILWYEEDVKNKRN